MHIALATTNHGKIKEIQAILDAPGISWLTRADVDDWPRIEETGATFLDNARLKARAIAAQFALPALADDSGLEVDVLDGRPGVNSARFAGPQATDTDNINALAQELKAKGSSGSRARFRSAVVLAWPDGRELVTDGVCEGRVVLESRGQAGFGYDPVFIPDGFDKTLAELGPDRKNELSHRGHALRDLKHRLDQEGWAG